MMLRIVFIALGLFLAEQAHGQDRPWSERLHKSLLPLFSHLEDGEVGSWGIAGDSVSLLSASYNWQVRNRLVESYGNAGEGYLALARFDGRCNETDNGPRCGLDMIRGPGSTVGEDTGIFDPLGYATPDGMWGLLTPTPFPGNLSALVYGNEAIVHYTRRVGGGLMTVRLNGVAVATVDTGLTSGEPQAGRLVVETGVTDQATLSTLKFETAGPSPVQVNAVEMRSDLAGSRYHRLARGGAGAFMFQDSMTAANGEVLRSLEMDLLIVMIDASFGDGEDPVYELYESNLATLVDWYMAQLPGVPIIMITHHPFRPAIEAQADAILRIARQRELGFINLYDLFSGHEEMDNLGYLNGRVHLSPLGGQFFGGYIHGLIDEAGKQAAIADQNRDGRFDFFDVQQFFNIFSAGDYDLNEDGITDFFDVLTFMVAWSSSTAE